MRQTLADLTGALRRAGHAGIERLSSSPDVAASLSGIAAAAARFDARTDQRAYSDVLLAAAMPDEDFPAFVFATALLLADRLQGGGSDDLYWNWEAFEPHYRLADPPARAALMNGFRTLHRIGRVSLDNPPTDEDCLTSSREKVLGLLASLGENAVVRAIEADVPATEAGRLWLRTGAEERLVPGFRYLYERRTSMVPPGAEKVALIPYG